MTESFERMSDPAQGNKASEPQNLHTWGTWLPQEPGRRKRQKGAGPMSPESWGGEEQGQREVPRTHLAEDPTRKLKRCVCDPLQARISIWSRCLRLPAQPKAA